MVLRVDPIKIQVCAPYRLWYKIQTKNNDDDNNNN